jgi:hypothetical protein
VTDAEAVLPGPLWIEVTAPVVSFVPAVVASTFTVKVHEPLAGSVAPVKLTLDEPATAVIVPPHEPVRPFGVATTRPAGSVSLKPTPVNAAPLLGFEMVNVRVVVPFTLMLPAPNALLSVGGAVAMWAVLVTWAVAVPGASSVSVTVTEKFPGVV